ncbi:MAG TPA: hypothetical protein VFG50_15305 [Rhodothermales bacterium]|nr:hypothetical protein [Rhodothermales bacterium]
MVQLGEEALAASRAAENAATVDDVKKGAAQVFESMWGMTPADIQAGGALPFPGWKEAWQVTGAEFDSAFVARLGSNPPRITDPAKLGIEGRGRAARIGLEALAKEAEASSSQQQHITNALASLQDVIGWMELWDGVTKGERQPRVDLTRVWTSSDAFWNSTSDTGWLWEPFSQAINIMKTDYQGDVATARQHAADMTALIEKYLNGVDADNDGTISPVKMEGGLYAAVQEARAAGLIR